MSRRQSNQIVKDVKVNDISICNSNEISNAFNEHFSTIGPRLAREMPLTSDEESVLIFKKYYWKLQQILLSSNYY